MGESTHKPPALSVRELASLAAAFAAVHALAYAAGLRFIADSLGLFMQFLDPELLRERLLESLFYMHIQPPLFNLFLGAGLKLGDTAAPVFFHGVFLVLGFAMYAAIYALQRRLGVSRAIAGISSTLFMASPPFLLTGHWLFYTFPCAALLTLSCLWLDDFTRTGRRGPLWAFFGCLVLLSGMRTVFHLVWLATIGFGLLAVFPRHRKRVACAATVAFVLCMLPYAKNAALFGEFTVSSWSGKHLWIKTVGNMDPTERQRLYDEGLLTPVSRPGLNRFEATGYYPEPYLKSTAFTDIPVLHTLYKSTGHINYNHIAQIAISNDYGRDARYVLRRYPRVFAVTTAQSALLYLTSNASWARESGNYARLRPWVGLYDTFVYGRLPFNLFSGFRNISKLVREQYVVLMAALPAAFLIGVIAALRGRLGRQTLDAPARLILAYMVFNILYTGAVAVLFELAETARMRFMTDPLSVVLLGFAAHAVIRYVRPLRSGG